MGVIRSPLTSPGGPSSKYYAKLRGRVTGIPVQKLPLGTAGTLQNHGGPWESWMDMVVGRVSLGATVPWIFGFCLKARQKETWWECDEYIYIYTTCTLNLWYIHDMIIIYFGIYIYIYISTYHFESFDQFGPAYLMKSLLVKQDGFLFEILLSRVV